MDKHLLILLSIFIGSCSHSGGGKESSSSQQSCRDDRFFPAVIGCLAPTDNNAQLQCPDTHKLQNEACNDNSTFKCFGMKDGKIESEKGYNQYIDLDPSQSLYENFYEAFKKQMSESCKKNSADFYIRPGSP